MNATTITVGECRLSYVHVFEPYTSMPGQEPKYSAVLLIPKSNTAAKAQIDEAIAAAVQQAVAGKWNGAAPANVQTTLHDGDGVKSSGEPYGAECKGHWVLNAGADKTHQPQVVGPDRKPIIDQTQVYSGCYGWVNINFYSYNFNGRKGIGCGLNAIMKTRDGQPLGGERVSVEEAFARVQVPQQQAPAPSYGQAPAYGQPAAPAYGQPQQAPAAPAYGAQGPSVDPITGLPVSWQ